MQNLRCISVRCRPDRAPEASFPHLPDQLFALQTLEEEDKANDRCRGCRTKLIGLPLNLSHATLVIVNAGGCCVFLVVRDTSPPDFSHLIVA